MAKALGIINIEPSYVKVEGIEDHRPISASSVLGRYRVIDFMLSNLTNSGINNIDIQVKNRPRSTIQHVNNTNYNINTKKGNMRILYGEKPVVNEIYNTDIAALSANLEFIEESHEPYIIMAPSHFIFIQDFRKLIEHHMRSNNDVTILYQNVSNANEDFLMCDTLGLLKNKRVTEMGTNKGRHKHEKISLETYIMSKEVFKDLVSAARATSSLYSFSDILADSLKLLRVGAYCHTGYAACLSTLKAYYKASMDIKREKELHKMINDDWPIYTATNDTCPTLYAPGAKINNSIVGNGCVIEGSVSNCVIGRNVIIKKGAVVKDSIIMPDSLINKNVKMEKCVVDRLAIVTHVKELKGSVDEPLYIARGDRI